MPKLQNLNDLGYNVLGNYRKSNCHRWTDLAAFCYFRGCNCLDCIYRKYTYPKPCQMKASVLELVRLFGKPEIDKNYSTEYKRSV